MLTWNHRDSTPLSTVPQALKGDQGWIFFTYKSNYLLSLSGLYRIFNCLNWNLFEMRLLNLRINFFIADFCPHLGSFLFFFKECLPNTQETWVQSQVRIIPKTLKMVLDTSLLNTQQYKVHIEGKVDQFRELSSALPYTSV